MNLRSSQAASGALLFRVTELASPANMPPRLSVEELATAAQGGSAADLLQLAEIHPLLQTEPGAWTVDLGEHPQLSWLEQEADAQEQALGPGHPQLADGTVVHHSALACGVLDVMAQALAPEGYAVVRDIGLTDAEAAALIRGVTRYGATRAVAVNFVQLDRWFRANAHNGLLQSPPHEPGEQHGTRLLHKRPLSATVAAFCAAFDPHDLLRARRLAAQARDATDVQAAMELYRQAVQADPADW